MDERSWTGAAQGEATNFGSGERFEAAEKLVKDLVAVLFFPVWALLEYGPLKMGYGNKPPFHF